MTVQEKKDQKQMKFKIEDLEKSVMALGDLYIERTSLSPLKLQRAGDFLDVRQIDKIKRSSHSRFRFVSLTHSQFVLEGLELWEQFKNSESESERQKVRKLILHWFSSVYWEGKTEGSLLDLIHVTEKSFWRFDKSFLENYWNSSTMIFKRSVLLSSLIPYLALASGYTDYKYLSDVCHVSLLLDCSFDQSNFSYLLAQACESERQSSDEKNINLVDHDQEVFLSHPQLSYEKASVQCAKYLFYKHTLELVLKHHEKTNGLGWPRQISEGEFSDIENIFISLNQILPYLEKDYKKDDGVSYLKLMLYSKNEEKLALIPVKRLELLLKSVFEQKDGLSMAKGA